MTRLLALESRRRIVALLSSPSGRARLLALTALLALSQAACRHVNAYERTKLAHPTMTSLDLPGPAEEHVYSVQEGAVGGGASATSGCGCN